MTTLSQSAHMGHGAKSSPETSWTLLKVQVVAKGKFLIKAFVEVYAENL